MNESKDEVAEDKIKRVEHFLKFARANKNIGFCQTIEGHICYDSNGNFCISTHNLKPVCRINKDGINEVTNNELDDEDLLIADKMYLGSLTSNENLSYIFLEKMINGQRKMKAISYNQKIYDIFGEKNLMENIIPLQQVIIYDNINDFFKKNNFSFLASNIYTKESFSETITAFNKLSNMLPKERSEIENIVEISTAWWIDNLSIYSFDSGMYDIDPKLNLLRKTFFKNIPPVKENEVQKFKDVLGNRIRVGSMSSF